MTALPTTAALVFVSAAVALAAAATAAPPDPPWVSSPAPVEPGSSAPRLATDGQHLFLSWIAEATASRETEVRVARLDEGGWAAPVTVHAGSEILGNWADTPRLEAADTGRLAVAWPSRIEGPESYGVRLATSSDEGVSWSDPAWLHDDLGPTEHSFPALQAGHAFWLDGRATPDGGATGLFTRLMSPDRGSSERVLDDRVCECCSLDAALTHRGPVLVYRDRSPEEVRDIFVVRQTAEGWQVPSPVSDDGWRLHGCPVQGPAVSALAGRTGFGSSDALLVAWFTAAGDRPRVLAVFSSDAGVTFAAPIVVDGSRPVGRVSTELLDENRGWVAWLDREAEGAALKVALVDRKGIVSAPEIVAPVTAARASGVPSLELWGDHLYLAWTRVDDAGVRTVEVARRPIP